MLSMYICSAFFKKSSKNPFINFKYFFCTAWFRLLIQFSVYFQAYRYFLNAKTTLITNIDFVVKMFMPILIPTFFFVIKKNVPLKAGRKWYQILKLTKTIRL
jgi:hypothetical protein